MKGYLLLIACWGMACTMLGQSHRLKDYELIMYRINQVQEWTIKLDTNGNPTDTSLTEYDYDTLGRITEKRWAHRDNPEEYKYTTYHYNEKGLLHDTVFGRTYNPGVLDGVYYGQWQRDSVITEHYEFDRLTCKEKIWEGGTVERWDYEYHHLYAKDSSKVVMADSPYAKLFNSGWQRVEDCYDCYRNAEGTYYMYIASAKLVGTITYTRNEKPITLTRFTYSFY